jgi:hypothetical protein
VQGISSLFLRGNNSGYCSIISSSHPRKAGPS